MKTFSLFYILFLCPFLQAQIIGIDIDTSQPSGKFQTGKDLLAAMHQQFKSGPCQSYTFSQKNTHYRNDSVIGHSEWHEAIEFPDKFRINFGNPEDGNFIIFKNDSSYRYQQFLKKGSKYNANSLLLLLGGMFYRDLDDVYNRLKAEHYQTEILSSQKWNKQAVYVIGALPGDTLSNQIWVSKKNWKIVRIIERSDADHVMDMTFDAYQKHCRGFVETKVTFKDNGKIEQVEEYYDIKSLDSFSKDVFNPTEVKK